MDHDTQRSQAGGDNADCTRPERQVRDIKEGRKEVCKGRNVMKNSTVHVSPHESASIRDAYFVI
jgi:hypothetical protein